MIIEDAKLEKRIAKHCIAGKPLSELNLPPRVVIRALTRTGVGAVLSSGRYAVVFDPTLVMIWRFKSDQGIRHEVDDGWRDILAREGVPDAGGDIGDILSALDRAEIARLREQPTGFWRE